MPFEWRLVRWGNKPRPIDKDKYIEEEKAELKRDAAKQAAKEMNEEINEMDKLQRDFLIILIILLIETVWLIGTII